MAYTIEISSDLTHYVRLDSGEKISVGDMVYQDDLWQWGPKKIKKFFFPEGNEILYAQFDEGYGCNDGCLPVTTITKIKPAQR